jgi:hypothetical protein
MASCASYGSRRRGGGWPDVGRGARALDGFGWRCGPRRNKRCYVHDDSRYHHNGVDHDHYHDHDDRSVDHYYDHDHDDRSVDHYYDHDRPK